MVYCIILAWAIAQSFVIAHIKNQENGKSLVIGHSKSLVSGKSLVIALANGFLVENHL